MDVIENILKNVLFALYQPFWFALLCSVLAVFAYMFCYSSDEAGHGFKYSVRLLIKHLKSEKQYRILFFYIFYTMMILFRTLVNRNLWLNPLSEVMGNWWIYKMDANTGEMVLTTECIENVLLFIPYSFLRLEKNFEESTGVRFRLSVYISIRVVFGFSCLIEFLQLFLRVGSFQLSDIFYNTLGGVLGAVFFYLYKKIYLYFKSKIMIERE